MSLVLLQFVTDQTGHQTGVIVPIDLWREIEELLEDIEDTREIREIEARIARGEEPLYDWEDVKAELDALPD